MVEAKLLRKKLKNGLIVDKWDLVTIIEKQQAEIEALKKEAALQRLSDFTQEIEAKYGITTKWDGITTYHETTEPIGKVKELTDEEIKFIAYPFESVYTTYDKQTDTDTVHTRFDQLGFARAILRKAQEK